MDYITEPARQIPVRHRPDVLVIGSGPAGMAAAISAARMGAQVLVVEQCGTPGGISTAGMMSHWTGTCGSTLYHEILRRAGERNLFSKEKTVTIDPEQLRTLYFEMLAEAGASIQLYTFAADVIKEGNRVTGIFTESKSGREAILARVIIDASGDGDIAARAGVPYTLGREEDGKMQPATVMFKVGGVDTERAVFLPSFESTYETPRGELQALARQHLPAPAGHVLLYRSTLPGVVTCNMTNCTDIDGTDVRDLTRAEAVCRSQMNAIVDFLRTYVPGYENCYLLTSASLCGIRESRHFHGKYTLTESDILNARVFEDAVVYDAWFNFDVHNLTGSGLDPTGQQKKFPQKHGYTIPYGCMVPEMVEGLLLCGRNISGTHLAHSNFRVMPICVGIGQSCGIAAALAVRDGILPSAVSAADIQAHLRDLPQ